MTTGNTTLLGLALPVEGELDGTWGDVVNDSITSLLDSAIAGTTTLSADADVTLTTTALAANQARQAIIRWTASNGATTRNITAPAQSKPYIVINAGTGSIVLRGAGPTTGITIVAGERCVAAWSGSDFVKISSTAISNLTSGVLQVVNGGTGVTTSTGSGNAVLSNSPTLVTPALGTPASGVLTNATGLPLSTGVTGILPVVNGGTGTSTPSLVQGSNITITGTWPNQTIASTATGGLSSVSVAASNGFSGTSSGGSTPILTLATSVTGVIKGNGTALSAATAGTDFVAPGGALGTPSSGTVTNLTGTASININGTVGVTTPNTGSFTSLTSSSGATLQGLTVGRGAGAVSTNTAVGASALIANTTGAGNVAVGAQTLDANTTGADNTGIGLSALGANTTGASNVAVGYQALLSNTTASFNIAVGSNALLLNTTGEDNIAIGGTALFSNTTANKNIAIGRSALSDNTSGASNVAVGYQALDSSTTASDNTAIGDSALRVNTTGYENTALGHDAGVNITTGFNNTCIGNSATSSSATVFNEITLGNSSVGTLRCQVTTITSLSDARDKTNVTDLGAGLGFVNALRPVKFDWNMRDGGKIGIPDTGFIAQDLQTAQFSTGVEIPGLVFAENPDKLEAGYGKLIPVLVKAVQELSAEVERLKSQIKGA